jgi:phospholipid/cholesterol/gamma-HCH transport system ATP-binding protein
MIIEFRNVTKRFGEKTVLDSISLTAKKGEIIFILGQSGTGKSVLLKCLVGLLKPEGGEIFVNGENIVPFTESKMQEVRKKCGMVFQQPALFDSISNYENLAYGLRRHFQLSEQNIQDKIFQVLEAVHLPESVLNQKPQQISYGMQKRVSLARTLILEPETLLFDEPTTGLDPVTTTAINRLIQEVSEKYNTTSIVVSHDMKCAMEAAHRILFLEKGKKIFDGLKTEVRASAHPLVQEFFHEVEA